MSTPAVANSEATGNPDEYQQRWETIWAGQLKPGERFDAKQSSPALIKLLEKGALPVKGARVFVPGCGRGYDCVAFSQAGAKETVGLELAESAIKPANEYIESQLGQGVGERCRVIKGDFFKASTGAYDIGYDYTFLCALLPSMREDWARGWKAQLRPGGKLITLIFPTDASFAANPPWHITPDLCKELLLPLGFELESLDKVPDSDSHPGRGGMEYMAVWTRR